MKNNKIISALLCGLFIISLTGCGNHTEKNEDAPENSTTTADVTSTTNISDDSNAEKEILTESQSNAETSSIPEKQKPTEEKTSTATEPPHKTEKPKETESKPIQVPTKPQPTEPTSSVPIQEPEQPANATAEDAKAIADKVVEYINSYRATPATQLPGLTKYAEYRSRQLVSNFAHDTDDERAAATALKYGTYVNPAEYGIEGEPYYSSGARDAIVKGGYVGTVDYVAQRIATLVRNSSGHWAYVGATEYEYIGVGITYRNGMWYCDISMAEENTDNK